MARNEGLYVCGSICFFIIFVVSAGLVGGSFKILDPFEYGLLQNSISKEIDASKVYLSGRYFTGLARQFIIYPRPAQSMLFGAYPGADGPSLSLLISGEGTVTMDFSLQYTLNNNTLVTLYQSFGTAYKGRFAQAVTSSLQAALLQPSNNITVRNFYDSRQRVASVAQAAAATALQANGATLIGFQILRVSLPTTVENNIINTLVSSQQQLTAGMIQSQVSINAATSFYVGLIDQAISVYTSNQTALAAVITNTANAQAKSTSLNAASEAYKAFTTGNSYFSTGLGFSNDDVLKYRQLKNLGAVPSTATVVADFNTLSALVS